MKKAITTILLTIIILSMAAITVHAANEISVSSLDLGSGEITRSNPKANGNEDKIVNISGKLKFTNNDASNALSGITVIAEGIDAKYNIKFGTAPASVPAGQTGEIDVTITIPGDADSFDSTRADPNNDRRFDIGNLKVSGTINSAAVSASNDVFLQVENKIKFDKVKVEINGDSKSIDDGDDIKVKPGDSLSLIVKIENLFDDSSSEDIEIQDVEVKIDIEKDGDFDLEDKKIDFGDVNPESTEEKSITIDIEEDAKDEDHNVVLVLKGKDENGATHGEVFEFEIKVQREDHDLKIKDIGISPFPISCSTKNLEVSVRVLNIGSGDEDQASIKLEISGLNHRDRIYDLSIDEDDDLTKTFRVPVPSGIVEGDYPVSIETYYDRTRLANSESVLLSMPDCEPVVQPIPEPIPQPIPEPTPEPAPQPTPQPDTVEPEPMDFGNSVIYLWILGIIIIILIVVIIILAVKFMGKD